MAGNLEKKVLQVIQAILDGQEKMAKMVVEVQRVIQGSQALLDLLDNEEGKEQQVLQDNQEHRYKENLYLDHRDQEEPMEILVPLVFSGPKEKGEKEAIKE